MSRFGIAIYGPRVTIGCVTLGTKTGSTSYFIFHANQEENGANTPWNARQAFKGYQNFETMHDTSLWNINQSKRGIVILSFQGFFPQKIITSLNPR